MYNERQVQRAVPETKDFGNGRLAAIRYNSPRMRHHLNVNGIRSAASKDLYDWLN